MDIALLIIDMQNSCREGCRYKEAFDEAAGYINEASRMCREKGAPVVLVKDLGEGQGPGSQGFDVVPGILRADTDLTVHKGFNNAFCKTGLESTLRGLGVRFVVVSGYAAEHCALFTFNGARECGFNVSILQRGVAGETEHGAESLQLLRPVVSLQALHYMLNQ